MAETEKNKWTAIHFEHQVNSQFFERFILSNDVQSILTVARESKKHTDAKEIIKDPMVINTMYPSKKKQ